MFYLPLLSREKRKFCRTNAEDVSTPLRQKPVSDNVDYRKFTPFYRVNVLPLCNFIDFYPVSFLFSELRRKKKATLLFWLTI